MTLLDVALDCVRRGWFVFPCKSKGKQPLGSLAPHGFKDATLNEAIVRDWWTKAPDANIGIATGPSRLRVVDFDHGLSSTSDLQMLIGPVETYAVRTGRRPEFGVQVYYQDDGTGRSLGGWERRGCTGDVRAQGGYVMAAGSIHPSGEPYEVLYDLPLQSVPDWVKDLKPVRDTRKNEPGQKVREGEGRHDALTSVAGGLRNRGLDADAIYAALGPINDAMCEPPVDDEDIQHIADSVSRYALPEPDLQVRIGRPKEDAEEAPKDWRERYHSFAEIHDTKPPSFVIKDFLQEQSITGLAAPVGQRKSLIALNVAHACLTGEPLFGYFDVEKRPARVLYLCPEMGLISFANRLKLIGLEPYVGETLFCRTMGSEPMDLSDLTEDELRGAVVIIDTAVRFLKGDENSPKDMSVFAQSIFRLSNAGALAVVLLHHSTKATKDSPDLTLENTMRGSGELGAFLTTCWATKMRDPNDEYKSASYIKNVKPRDFECKPFDAVCDRATCRMSIVGAPGDAGAPVRIQKDKDGKEDAALAIIRVNVSLSNEKLSAMLAEHGIKRSPEWVRKHKRTGTTHTSG